MEQIRLALPVEFVRAHVGLTWRDVRFGLDHELLEPQAAQVLAMAELGAFDAPAAALSDLAAAQRDEPTRRLVDALAEAEPERDDEELRRRWLYLVLAWLYENRDRLAEPLAVVEAIYADFGYPEEMESFVRYLPAAPGARLGDAALLARWATYLEAAGLRYRPAAP